MTGRLANDLQGQLQYVTFTPKEAVYSINRIQVKAVLREIEVTPVPVAPHDVGGVIHLPDNASGVLGAQRQIIGILVDFNKPLSEAGFGEI